MWRMLQQDQPGDYVLATGTTWTVRDFVAASFGEVGLNWEHYVEIDPAYYRPSEVDALIGDAGRAERVLGWKARTHTHELVRAMLAGDRQQLADQQDGRLIRLDRG